MKTPTTYSKKISSEEAKEGYVLVLKNQLPFFPASGRSFRVLKEGHAGRVKVESYPCSCRGPRQPHRHFFIRLRGTSVGDRVVFRQEGGKERKYIVQVQRRRRA